MPDWNHRCLHSQHSWQCNFSGVQKVLQQIVTIQVIKLFQRVLEVFVSMESRIKYIYIQFFCLLVLGAKRSKEYKEKINKETSYSCWFLFFPLSLHYHYHSTPISFTAILSCLFYVLAKFLFLQRDNAKRKISSWVLARNNLKGEKILSSQFWTCNTDFPRGNPVYERWHINKHHAFCFQCYIFTYSIHMFKSTQRYSVWESRLHSNPRLNSKIASSYHCK